MGSEEFYPEERPVRRVAVEAFWMDEHAVTAADFRRFVRETGYVTVAERPLDPADYPDADPELLVPGAPRLPQDERARAARTTSATGGSTCRAPTGSAPADPGTTINGRDRHPVVQVAFEDAEAYAALGGQGAADRGRVGVRSPRRARGTALRVGRRALPRRAAGREHVAGRVPLAEPQARRPRGHLAGRELRSRTATASTT